MKPKSLFLLIMLSVILIFTLAACGTGTTEQDESPQSAEGSPEETEYAKWPEGNIEWFIPYDAGGNADMQCRILASAMGEILGTTIIPVNMPGGAGVVCAEHVVRSDPDGYSITMGNIAMNGTQLNMDSSLSYGFDDFTYICNFVTQNILFVVPADSPIKDFDDFIDRLKAEPGKYTYGTTGTGVTSHMAMELLSYAAGVEAVMIPYGSGAEINAALLGGELDFAAHFPGSATPLLESGDLRCLAVSSVERTDQFPDYPALGELGFGEDAVFASYHAIAGPAGIPDEIVNKIADACEQALQLEEVQEQFTNMGVVITYKEPKEFKQYASNMYDAIAVIVEEKDLKVQ